jgi:hypothetical protein
MASERSFVFCPDSPTVRQRQRRDQSGLNPAPTPIIGGSIIGVASKINRRSLMIYEGGTKYIEWEFFWDPDKYAAVTIGQPPPGVTPSGNNPPSPRPRPPQN